MTAMVQPLPLDQIDTDAVFYGVKVAGVGDENDIVAFTHDRRRAIGAANRYVREVWCERSAGAVVSEPAWWQVIDTPGCGCGDDCPHVEESWEGYGCDKDAPNAVPVLVIEVEYR